MDTERVLLPHLGAFEVFTISSGTMIGAGIFILPGIVSAKSGPASILAFLFAGLISACAGLSVSELATAMPKAGGSYYFVSRSMGAMWASIVGWGSILGLVFKGAFALIGAGEYFEVLVPVAPLVTALFLCGLLTLANVLGTRLSGQVQNVIVVLLIIIMGAFVIRGLFSLSYSNFVPFAPKGYWSVLGSTGLVFISYLGLINVSAVAEEVKNPDRNIPLGIVGSIIFVSALYVLVMLVTEGLLPVQELARKLTPLADSAELIAGSVGLVLITISGLLATTSTANAAILSTSRYPFAMARDGLMPKLLSHISKALKTPARSIVLVGAVMFGLLVLVDLENIVKIGSVFNILVFSIINGSVIILRKAKPPWYKPGFRSPGYPWVQLFGLTAALALVPAMGWVSVVAAIAFCAFGVGWFYLYGRGKAQPRYHLRDIFRTIREEAAVQKGISSLAAPLEESGGILVPLWDQQIHRGSMLLAGYLARQLRSVAHLLYCEVTPPQTPLPAVRDEALYECVDLDSCLLPLDESFRPFFTMETVLGTSRHEIFLEVAEGEKPDFILIEWPPLLLRFRWELYRIMKRAPCDVVVFVNRGLDYPKRILVAWELPYDEMKVKIAGALAEESEGTVTVLRVISPRTQEISNGGLEHYLDRITIMFGVPAEGRVVRSEDAIQAIMEEAERHDLVIVGSTPNVGWSRSIFGHITDELVERIGSSVLVVKHKGLKRFGVVGRFMEHMRERFGD